MALHELKELGRGTFGRVFLAYDDETGTQVAVKELLDPNTDLDRFAREARMLADQVHNMYVVNIIRSELSRARPRIVLEYCEGGSLRSWVGKATWQQSATALLHAANGLLGLHSVNGFHRDIKPENLLLAKAPTGDGHIVKVADFGIARRPMTALPPMTRSPGGTDGYIAPEMAVPNAQFSAQADVYSLGVVGIELMTGGRSAAALATAVAPDEFKKLLARMVSTFAFFRPSTADVIIALGKIIATQSDAVAPQRAPTQSAPVAAPPPRAVAVAQQAPPPAAKRGNDDSDVKWWLLLGGVAAGLAAAAAIAAGDKTEWDENVGRYRGPDGRFRSG